MEMSIMENFHDSRVHLGGISGILALVKTCSNLKDLQRGGQVHAIISKTSFLKKSIYIGNSLVHMYAKCGDLEKAREIFNQLPVQDVVSWTALISGFMRQGQGDIALACFDNMQQEGICPNEATFISILESCGCTQSSLDGQRIHARLARKDWMENSRNMVGNALVDMYAKCGHLGKAQEVFDQLECRDVISWTALITGHARHDQGEEAVKAFNRMQQEGVCPNLVTYTCVLKAYGSIRDSQKGREIHAKIVYHVNLKEHHFLGNTLLDMYAKCGSLSEAEEVFNDLETQDVVSWTALIRGYAVCGHSEEALNLFQSMQEKGISPNTVTLICVFKACCTTRAIQRAFKILPKDVDGGMLKQNYIVGNALVDMYAKCGLIENAQEVFDWLPAHDRCAWNSLIAGYAQHGHHDVAFHYFERMQVKVCSPDIVTFLTILRLCAVLGAAHKGQEIHTEVTKHGLFERHDAVLGSVLVDMYAGSGMLPEAHVVFNKIVTHDLTSWTSLIQGYSQSGKHDSVFAFLRTMVQNGNEPDALTLTIILNTCSHSGLLDVGEMYFKSSINLVYGFIPDIDHYTCIIDLLCRAGNLERAMAMITDMPCFVNLTIWHIILSACRTSGDVELGKLAFDHAVQLNDKDVTSYICMSHIDTVANMEHTR
jgi:pentatricopeptide repeat protein